MPKLFVKDQKGSQRTFNSHQWDWTEVLVMAGGTITLRVYLNHQVVAEFYDPMWWQKK